MRPLLLRGRLGSNIYFENICFYINYAKRKKKTNIFNVIFKIWAVDLGQNGVEVDKLFEGARGHGF